MKTRMLVVAAIAATSLAACASQPRSSGYGYDRGYSDRGYSEPYDRRYSQPQRCYNCGRIERIEQVYGARQNSRTGAVLGGLVGAVAAREIPDHGSEGRRNTATVAGAVAGAVAGNAIENRVNDETFDIHVRMEDGRLIVINRNSLGNGIREGAYVRVDGNRLELLR
ncbi:peptidoglycan-associated outer membrane lipoprotein precursor [Arenimonas sp.]|uniref:peptidoglycan-associated outer membrane lipoprotein precursor n=1 Tax=Arenimonas sp. TaxID=1872635 RepID=UPI0035AE83A4